MKIQNDNNNQKSIEKPMEVPIKLSPEETEKQQNLQNDQNDNILNEHMKAIKKKSISSRDPFTVAFYQISGIIQKNLLIKLHNYLTTAFEVLFNLIVIILYMVRQVYVNKRVDFTPEGGILDLIILIIPFVSQGTFKVVTQQILEEKNSKMIENLKILGMREQNQTIALLLTEVVLAGIVGLMNFLVLWWWEMGNTVDLLLLVFAFIFYSLGTASFSLMLSTLFSSPLAAVIINAVIIQWPGLLYQQISTQDDGWKTFYCINPVVAFMALFGEQVPNTGVLKYGFDIQKPWAFIVCSFVYFQAMQLYLDSSVANDVGVKKDAITDIFQDGGVDFKQNPKWPIHVKKLTKIFNNKTIGLNEMTIKIPSNQVTCILGHNGAGKTTLINILTGMYEQSKGQAYIYGKPTKEFMTDLRLQFGVCPQFDILQEGLTVYQHIALAHNLKGLLYTTDTITNLLKITYLEEAAHKKAWQLSGGMKRMLSLTMALIGDPDIIFMDEPTSSMDAEIRSKLRKVIRKLGKTKTIILTTQHMDEAEELADKVCLMSKGRLHTWGDVNEIKQKFGAGYNLYFFHLKEEDVIKVEDILTRHILKWTKNEFHDHAENDRIYILPLDQIDKYSRLLTELETLKLEMNIEMASLEESFINFHIKELKEELDTFNDDGNDEEQDILDTNHTQELDPSFRKHSSLNVLTQIMAIIERKMRVSKREQITIFSVALPGFIIFIQVLFIALTGVMRVTAEGGIERFQQMYDSSSFQVAFTSFIINIAYAFGSAHIIFNIVRDRVENTRYLQNAKGMLTFIYWMSNLLADLIIYLIPLALVFIQFRISGVDFLVSQFWTLVSQFICQGLQLISLTQILSYLFSNQISAYYAQGWIMFFVFFIAQIVGYSLIQSYKEDVKFLNDQFDQIVQAFCSSPAISFFISTQVMAEDQQLSFDTSTIDYTELRDAIEDAIKQFKKDKISQNPLFSKTEISLFVMLAYSMMQILICMTIDYYRLNNFRQRDNNEIKERDEWKELPYDEKIEETYKSNIDNCNVHIKGVSKTQSNIGSDKFTALSEVNLSIKPGEIFGLLGPNGAGKSTFFNIATMNETRSTGEVTMFGNDIESSAADTYLNSGIAPQPNYLFENYTVYEHLWYYSNVKGLSFADSKVQINQLILNLDLADQRDSQANELSGGNKRKLMCAIALISCPKLVFLDEPTTGVDPVARMKLRKTIKNFAKFIKSTQIYTTHYMQEAEQICDRVAILINGKVIVVATIEELRKKYGQGFSVSLYFTEDTNKKEKHAVINKFKESIKDQNPEVDEKMSKRKEEVVFKIAQDKIKQGVLFQSLLQLKNDEDIKDFIIEKANLEHIFLQFARFQNGQN